MTQEIFSTLQHVLRPKERLRFTISLDSTELVVLLEPLLAPEPANVPQEAAQARACLATPLRLQGSGAQLDEEFSRRVMGYAEVRQRLGDSHDELLQTLREANKETQAKVNDAKRNAKSRKAASPAAAPSRAPDESAGLTAPIEDSHDAPASTSEVEAGKPFKLF
jgi:PRTRC genetic system protein E